VRRAVRGSDGGGGLKKLILAVAAYVDGESDEPPPELSFWFQVRDWGDPWAGGFMRWPAQLFTRVRLVRRIYETYRAYTRAENRVEWTNTNPGAAEIVGIVKQYRYEDEDQGSSSLLERWELWRATDASSIS
jgi:hypothetical protein